MPASPPNAVPHFFFGRRRATEGNRLEVIYGGSAFFDRYIQLLDSARYFVFIQVYILQDDETGQMIRQALLRAASRGVKVHLYADAYGSRPLPDSFIQALRSAGIEFRFFGPLRDGRRLHLGRRMHHKVLVVDGRQALVSGRNLSDSYNDLPGKPAWLDFAVQAEGPVVAQLLRICLQKWFRKRMKKIPPPYTLQPEAPVAGVGCMAEARENDALLRKQQVSASYLGAIRMAQKEILIVGGYFLPGSIARYRLKKATRQGVRVAVLTGRQSDIGLVKYARRYLYQWMLREGIEMYEYRETVVHGKVLVADESWCSLGSYDLNNLSAYSNIELNLDFYDPAGVKKLRDYLCEKMERESDRVTPEFLHRVSGRFHGPVLWFSYYLVRILFRVSQLLAVSNKQTRE